MGDRGCEHRALVVHRVGGGGEGEEMGGGIGGGGVGP